jgi:hypothetical protein
MAQLNMKNPDFHKRELEDAFKYIGTIDTNDDGDKNNRTDGGGGEDGSEAPMTPFIVKK